MVLRGYELIAAMKYIACNAGADVEERSWLRDGCADWRGPAKEEEQGRREEPEEVCYLHTSAATLLAICGCMGIFGIMSVACRSACTMSNYCTSAMV